MGCYAIILAITQLALVGVTFPSQLYTFPSVPRKVSVGSENDRGVSCFDTLYVIERGGAGRPLLANRSQ